MMGLFRYDKGGIDDDPVINAKTSSKVIITVMAFAVLASGG